METNGGTEFRVLPLRLIILYLAVLETEGLVDFQGRAGIPATAQSNLRRDIFSVDNPDRT